MCVYALAGRLAPDLASISIEGTSLETPRLFDPIGYWNALGAWAAATTAFALAVSADTRRTERSVALALVPIAACVIYLTYSGASSSHALPGSRSQCG